MIWRLLIGGLWKPIAALVALLGVWVAGKRSATQAAKIDTLEQEDAAHARINEADLGIGASDADNQRWLREFADKHGNR
jgi:type VI protein secretion system component VasK